MTSWKEVKQLASYREHHYEGKHDVGVAWTDNRLWVCLDGVSLFRGKLMNGKLFISFTPPENYRETDNDDSDKLYS